MPLKSTPGSLAVEARSRGNCYDIYQALGRAMRGRYIEQIRALDPRLGATHTMHNAHNWWVASKEDSEQKRAIVALIERYQKVERWVRERAQMEHYAVEHRIHLQEGRAGRYLWCPFCKAHQEEQAAIRQPRLPLRAPRRRAARQAVAP